MDGGDRGSVDDQPEGSADGPDADAPGEAAKQFRRVNGHLRRPALRIALDATAATPVTSTKEDAA
jgi:hypothetical protein